MQDVASYKATTSLDTDKKVNLVYGLNGTGKSTISNFLYNPSASRYSNCSYVNNSDAKILVYNQKFIQDYFYEASGNLKGVFSLSKQNKEIEEAIEAEGKAVTEMGQVTQSIREELNSLNQADEELLTSTQEDCWSIKKQYTGGDRVLEYCFPGLMGRKDKLFSHLISIPLPESKPDRSVEEIKADVEQISSAAGTQFDKLPLVAFEPDVNQINSILGKEIVGSGSSQVSSLIEKLQNSDWVSEGRRYLDTDDSVHMQSCPFCQEKTISSAFIDELETYFDKSYEDSKNEVLKLYEIYQLDVSELPSLDIYTSHPFVGGRTATIASYHSKLHSAISRNLSAFADKSKTPSIAVSIEQTKTIVESLNSEIEALNAEITSQNERISNIESEKQQLCDEFWRVMRWDYNHTISNWESKSTVNSTNIESKQSELDEQINAVAAKRAKISELQKSSLNIEASIDAINDGLAQLGITDFFITKHDDRLYKIVRADEASAEFLSLSEGEKMIISFLYFCEVCKGKQDADETIGNKVVVIDDPVSSLSHIFIFNIGALIYSEFFKSDLFEQVFVFTHSLYFFYELADRNEKRRKDNQKLFRLVKNESGSQIKNLGYSEIQNDYQSYWSIVADNNNQPALIANCMRNILEHFFGFVQKLEISALTDKEELQANRFQAFMRYINRESHSDSRNIFDYKEFNYKDFEDGLRLVFELNGYKEHYDKMSKSAKIP
jgi:wobble nucleotide-excising tRNase